jgi:DNA-binding transcriptional ArsR family regulator
MTEQYRQITDSKVLAAMAHPLRRRLLDVLRVDGPATASMLAERTGQAVGNISHHMRVLAGTDLVEEAPELAHDRRERWWRRTSSALRWTVGDFAGDPATAVVAEAANSLNLEHQVALVRAWFAAGEGYGEQWRQGPFATDSWLRVTPAELEQVAEEVIALLLRWSGREIPDDGQERESVFVFARGMPAKP